MFVQARSIPVLWKAEPGAGRAEENDIRKQEALEHMYDTQLLNIYVLMLLTWWH
jgi:hypothetical protein